MSTLIPREVGVIASDDESGKDQQQSVQLGCSMEQRSLRHHQGLAGAEAWYACAWPDLDMTLGPVC